MTHSTQYLYDIDPTILADMPYKLALVACKEGAKRRLWELMQQNYNVRDERLIYEVNKAFDWCEKKLEELR